jgi:hypothetical protein
MWSISEMRRLSSYFVVRLRFSCPLPEVTSTISPAGDADLSPLRRREDESLKKRH